ncbi:MAG: hypothetical protein V3T23_00245 [Nitrososphaerales archaeon]
MPRKKAVDAEAEQEATSKARIRYLLRNPTFQGEFNELRRLVPELHNFTEQLLSIGKFEDRWDIPFLAWYPELFRRQGDPVLSGETIPHFEAILTRDTRSDRLIKAVNSIEVGSTLYLSIDLTCDLPMESILATIKRALRQAFHDRRNQVSTRRRRRLDKLDSYLAVWDLRREGLSADEIAPKLWPTEYTKKGGRDSAAGDKGPLIQRVYDYEKAAQKLIDESIPPRKRSRKIKK